MENHSVKQEKQNAFKLTTWEAYNYVLKGLVDEVINVCGADPKIRLTAFQLWTAYLTKTEGAFFNDKEEVLPKLPAAFYKHDVNLLKNVAKTRKRKHDEDDNNETQNETQFDLQISRFDRKLLRSEDRSLLGHSIILKRVSRRNLVRTKFTMTRAVLLTIILCALNHHHSPIQLTDLIRFIKEGRISYFDCRSFLPPDLSKEEIRFINNNLYNKFPGHQSHKEFSKTVQIFTFFCHVDLNHPDMYSLCERYVMELGLPHAFYTIVEKIYTICPSHFDSLFRKSLPMHFYEGRAMAYIIFTLKLLFGLNGITEKAMSKSAKTINKILDTQHIKYKPLFVWTEWVEYFTARKQLISKYHNPTFFRQEEDYSDYDNKSTEHFLEMHDTLLRNKERSEVGKTKMDFSGEKIKIRLKRETGLARAARNMKDNKGDKIPVTKIEFPATLTPNVTYLDVLKANDDIKVPKVLEQDMNNRDIKYLFSSQKLKRSLSKSGHKLRTSEAPTNENVLFSGQKLKDWTKVNFQKTVAKFDVIETNIDAQTFVASVQTEANQTIINKMRAKEDTSTKQELASVKELMKEMMKRKRRKFRPTPNNIFDEIESSTESETEDDATTLLTPNFDYWTLLEYPHYKTQEFSEFLTSEFPEIFKWLLDNCAAMLDVKVIDLYFELLFIEVQFLYIMKPMYTVKDEILYQDWEKLGTKVRSTVRNLLKRFTEYN